MYGKTVGFLAAREVWTFGSLESLKFSCGLGGLGVSKYCKTSSSLAVWLAQGLRRFSGAAGSENGSMNSA